MLTYDEVLTRASVSLMLGEVQRATLHPSGQRESVTTHTVMLALLAIDIMAASPALRKQLDPLTVVKYALVHDLPEAITGDYNTFGGLSEEQRAKKAAAESDAISYLVCGPFKIDGWFLGADLSVARALCNYDIDGGTIRQGPSKEWLFVHALDKILPKLVQVLSNAQQLVAAGVTMADLERHVREQREALFYEGYPFPELCTLYDAATARVLLVFKEALNEAARLEHLFEEAEP